MSDGAGSGRVAAGLAVWLLFVLASWNLRLVEATGAAAFVYASLVLGLICILLPWLHASIGGRRAPLLRAWHDPEARLDTAIFLAIAVAALSLAALKSEVVRLENRFGIAPAVDGLAWLRRSLTVDMPEPTGFGALLLAYVVHPFAQEMLYRGYLQRYVFSGLRRFWAVVLVALLFALGDGGEGGFVGMWLFGVVLGTAVEITGRVWVGMLLHATLVLVILLLTQLGEMPQLHSRWVWLALPLLVGALAFLYHHPRRDGRVRPGRATP